MTIFNKIDINRAKRLFTTTGIITIVAFGLGACESSKKGGYSFGLSAPTTTASLSKTKSKKTKKAKKSSKSNKTKTAKKAKSKSYRMAVSPINGLPKDLSKTFASRLKAAIKNEEIKAASKHKVKGYFAATPQNGKTKVTYVLDVTNKAGKRIKRIRGTELVKGDPKNPWKNVSNSVLNKIAVKTATSLSEAVTGAKPVTMANRMPSEGETDRPTALKKAPKATASLKTNINHTPKMSTIIPAVEGAPGDGKVSLTRAIAKQLSKRGIKIETIQSPGVHTVKGYVSLKSLNQKQDQITIKWLVFNSKGRRLGIVSQKNAIAKGSLNGSWGRIANAAAGAAAKGIRKLLPNKNL